MPAKSQDYGHVCVISVEGNLIQAELDSCKKPFEQRVAARKVVDFIIDLGRCEFADSAGLESLLWMKRKAEDLGGQVKLIVSVDSLKTILHMTRLANRFEVHSDLAPALKNM